MPSANRVLGAVIAGGASRRFGSDKALALIDGRPMIDHVLNALRPQVTDIIICGRDWAGEKCIEDSRPACSGPLAGLESALMYAIDRDFRAVLTVPVDTLPLPTNLIDLFAGTAPMVMALQRLIGFWPVACMSQLRRFLDDGKRSVHNWIETAGAVSIFEPIPMTNINYPGDIKGAQSGLNPVP